MLENKKLEKYESDYEGEIWLMHPLGRLVSNYGRLKHIYKPRRQGISTTRITLGNITKTGYRKCDIKGKKKYVHRLVLEAFTSINEGEGKLCDHIDRNPLNNHISNLRWVSHKENANNRKSPEKFKHCKTCQCNK